MKINVRIDRQDGRIEELELEDYICGVVASEIGNAPMEACKAQAIAARTNAWPYASRGKTISDKGVQAFRLERMNCDDYPVAIKASNETAGEILYYHQELVSPCSFSLSNGGRTVSSSSRWGGFRPYLIEKDDPYDLASTSGKKLGHGVGMSQRGAMEMARRGFSHEEILSFYYPGTTIIKGDDGAMAKVKASYQVNNFKLMADQKWRYVAGGASEGEVDCSGAFTYWYKKAGSTMAHGSNTMWREYSQIKGLIAEMELVPGMAVFKMRAWDSSQQSNRWYGTRPGDMYHVGLYIGGGKVIEAKGKNYGVVYSDITEWKYCATLKNTDYDIAGSSDVAYPCSGIVSTKSGVLNIRECPTTKSAILTTAEKGSAITITGKSGDWYCVKANGKTGYASSAYITLSQGSAEANPYKLILTIYGDDALEDITGILTKNGIEFVIEGD